MSVFRITPTTQKYDWGKIGLDSKVAQFATTSSLPHFTLDKSATYAELWMGTHPSSPSLTLSNPIKPLSEYLAAHPNLIGKSVIDHFQAQDGNLPFLFKVLSINKALSIQAHPDKQTAEKLHAEKPEIYKDPNHKPEMAIAITQFKALCGFRPLSEISTYLQTTPEFAALIPPATLLHFHSHSNTLSLNPSPTPTAPDSTQRAALKDVWTALMTTSSADIKLQTDKLVKRYRSSATLHQSEKQIQELVLKLHDDFPEDVGIFCPFMLNYIQLQPGEAIFLGAGEPHAYISGDIIECMANSDNVIRAGLTPKLRDIPTLISSLTYAPSPPSKHTVLPTPFPSPDSHTLLYDPPIPEFSVLYTRLPENHSEEQSPIDGPSIVVVTEGGGTLLLSGGGELPMHEGDVVFVGAGASIHAKTPRGLGFFRAFVKVE